MSHIAFDFINAAANIATVAGLVYVIRQIRAEGRKDRTNFEDGFAREYRELVAKLPISAMLGKSLPVDPKDENLLPFYVYFDLCNQQAFMFEKGRIGDDAWTDWCEGIRDNLKLPAFKKAWEQVKEGRTDSFKELRQLEDAGFKIGSNPQ